MIDPCFVGAKVSDTPLIPSYRELAEKYFGTLWQEAKPADWALIAFKLHQRAERAEAALAGAHRVALEGNPVFTKLRGELDTLREQLAKARDEALEKAARFVETRELLFARCRASGATREVDDIKEYLVRGIRALKGGTK